MKLSKRQLKRIIREEYSRLKNKGLIKETEISTPIERDPVLAKAYEEGFEQGRHDSADGMESELHPYAFNSTEEYEAFKAGYEDAMYG
tara:strand:+ start:2150 stop:2413 length:264 start_codon:yes stop_codon:yes gene_type:complete